MMILTRKAVRQAWQRHPQAREPLEEWYQAAKAARWRNLTETRADFPHADAVGTCTVFNIGGNKYRLIVKLNYAKQKIFIKHFLTHAEYDKDGWKKDCS